MAQESPAGAPEGRSLFEMAGWREHFKRSRAVPPCSIVSSRLSTAFTPAREAVSAAS